MTDIKLSRRGVFQAAGGVAIGASVLPGVSLAASEAEGARGLIGKRYAVGLASVVLEDIVELPPRDRAPMELSARQPFIAVFRQEAGLPIEDGTHGFSSDGLTATPLMVSRAYSEDGVNRLEAVFN